MTNKILDFESRKEDQLLKRKEAKVDALREAFRLARAESNRAKAPAPGAAKKRKKSKKK
ncbi:MAG: hypothetical protein HQ498_00240 [Pseudohongiella sp.]|jgi:hypothetical protein|nr:hypothetical protein [Pseudohongiella sp.]